MTLLTAMNEFNSVNEFFSRIGCHFQCYNMGRLIQPIDRQTLIDFEDNKISWPAPFMQHAWLAILFWVPEPAASEAPELTQHHYVWFLKLPLDEQAKLNLIARDDFLRRLIEALTQHLQQSLESDDNKTAKQLHTLENAMKDNPYGFQPKQEQLANFHAIVHKHLSLPASQYYSNVQEYLTGSHGFERWTELGYQGFADIAARLDEQHNGRNNDELITRALTHLPASPIQVLGQCLEHHWLPESITHAIRERVQKELNSNDDHKSLASICAAAIHATAQANNVDLQNQLLKDILQSSVSTDIEVLASISGRCWQQLKQQELLKLFLEALANTEHGQGAFNAIIADLMYIPGMRESILLNFRSPERSDAVARAIGAFFSQVSQ